MARVRINRTTRVVRKSDNLSSQIDNEVVILNVPKGEYNGLDEIGTEIWKQLESPIEVSDLIVSLMKDYEVDEQQCVSDVMEFLAELIDNGLAEIKDGNE